VNKSEPESVGSQKQDDISPLLPFLRWAGGKRKLAALIVDAFPLDFANSSGGYFEPFVGGGAVMLHLGTLGLSNYIPGNRLHINDMNPDLVITYTVIRDSLPELVHHLSQMAVDTSKERYLKIRAKTPADAAERAARFIYLNKTCFNGLWRVNNKGEFNVPWGQIKNPKILDATNLKSIADRLQGSEITHTSYDQAVAKAKAGDLVYFDPPYIPLTSSSNFSKYAKADFALEDHEKLAETIAILTSKSVRVLLSNSDTEMSRQIFGKVMEIRQISASRMIAANSNSRGNVMEILGANFPVPPNSRLAKLPLINL
jgi:DNA adenine methylase